MRTSLEGGLLHQEKADAHQPDHGQGRHEEQRRVGQIVAVQAGEEDRGHQKDDRHAGQDGPKLAGQPGRPFGQVAIGAYDQPQRRASRRGRRTARRPKGHRG